MSGHFWLKLYTEMLDDLKVEHMTDHQFRRFIQMLLFAKELDNNGSLGSISDLCWRLRISQEECETLLSEFESMHITANTPAGWILINFAKRQERSANAERVANWRAKQKNVMRITDDITCNVTVAPVPSTSTSTSLIKEDLNTDSYKTVYSNYTNNFGALTPFIADSIKGAVEDYTAEWVNAAMNEAVKNEARKWNYVEAILKRWKTDGFKSGKKGGNGKSTAPHKVPSTPIVAEPGWHE
jgi:DnaD/phage-associated family protein